MARAKNKELDAAEGKPEPQRAAREETQPKDETADVERKAQKSDSVMELELKVTRHRFNPGQQVTVHDARRVDVQRRSNRAPVPEPVSKARVDTDGTLTIRVPRRGTYCVVGKPNEEDVYRYVTVTAK
jgi:hypothetical protein